MNSFLQTQWLPLFGDVVLRGTLLLLVAGCLAYLTRQNAALRHRIGVLTFIGLLLLPALSVFVPQWEVPIPTPRTSATETKSSASLPTEKSSAATSSNLAQSKPSKDVSPQGESQPPSLVSTEKGAWLPIARLLLGGWMVGVAIAMTRMVLSFVAVRRLQKQGCQPLSSGSLMQQCGQYAQELGIRRTVALCLAAEGSASMPMTWGWLRPMLLLPADALQWSGERLRSVLLHELSHIRRGDWAAQSLATLVCTFYWFHPLVWWALARLKADAESATDEQVIASGVKASDYCAHLLELACGGVNGQQTLRYGIPMAREADIEGRLSALLDTKRQRRGTSRVLSLFVVGSVILAVGIVSTLQLRLNAEPITPLSNNVSAPSAVLPDGGVVMLVGISSHPSQGKEWWAPNGDLLPVGTFVTSGSTSAGSPGFKTREFVAALQNVREDTSWRWRTQPSTNWAGGSAKFGVKVPANLAQSQLVALSATIPDNLSQLTVEIGVANGPWQTKEDWNPRFSSTLGLGKYSVSLGKGIEDVGKAVVVVTHTIFDDDVRIIAVDNSGREHRATRSETMGGSAFNQVTTTFGDLALRQIKSFRFQTRHFHWVTFPHVALDPNLQSKVSLSSLRPLLVPSPPTINWQMINPKMMVGIDLGKITTTTQDEVPVTLHLSLGKGIPLPKTDWSGLSINAAGYPHPIPANIIFRGINITGWKPTGREGEYTALVRQIRFHSKGEWVITARVPFPAKGNTTLFGTVSRHVIVQ